MYATRQTSGYGSQSVRLELDPSEDEVYALAISMDVDVKVYDLKRRFSSMILKWAPDPFEVRLERNDTYEEQRFSLAFALAKIELLGENLERVTSDAHRCRFPGVELSGPAKDEILLKSLDTVLPADRFAKFYKDCKMDLMKTTDEFKVPVPIVNLRLESLGLGRRSQAKNNIATLDAIIAGERPHLQRPVQNDRHTDTGFGVRKKADRRERSVRVAGM